MRVSYWAGNGWRLEWSFELPLASSILVYRSEGPKGPWTLLDTLPSNSVSYEDCLKEYRGFFKKVWYKIEIVDATDNLILESRPMSSESAGDLITNEIIRQHELTLKGVNGHPGYYAVDLACFKRTRFTEQYNLSRGFNGERMIANSSPDQNTGSAEGYANPILFRGRWINTVQKQSHVQVNGIREDFRRQLWTTNYPILETGDILCEKGTDRVYEVGPIDVRQPNNIVVSQTATCKQIDPQMWEAQNLRYPE